MDLPEIQEINRITYSPDDVIVARLRGRASSQRLDHVLHDLRKAFPLGTKIIVLDDSASLDVVTPA